MLQVARLAPKVLGVEAAELVGRFLRSQQHEDGGFKDRKGQSDLYYTVFGLDAFAALQQPLEGRRVRAYIESFGDGAGLDFVHLCALARSWAALERRFPNRLGPAQSEHAGFAVGAPMVGANRDALLQRLATFRARDGGFHPTPNSTRGTAYGAFLGLAAYQDLGVPLPEPMELVRSLKFLE